MSNSKARPKNGYAAQRAEATKAPGARTRVKFNGHTYNIPHPNNWELRVFDFMYQAQIEEEPMAAIGIMRELLGVGQWNAFMDRNKGIEAIGEFMKAVETALDKDADTPN